MKNQKGASIYITREQAEIILAEMRVALEVPNGGEKVVFEKALICNKMSKITGYGAVDISDYENSGGEG